MRKGLISGVLGGVAGVDVAVGDSGVYVGRGVCVAVWLGTVGGLTVGVAVTVSVGVGVGVEGMLHPTNSVITMSNSQEAFVLCKLHPLLQTARSIGGILHYTKRNPRT